MRMGEEGERTRVGGRGGGGEDILVESFNKIM